MAPLNKFFDEICVFDSIAERTGTQVERAAVRGRLGACRSLTELGMKSRRLGDGYYYLAASAWPVGVEAVQLNQAWSPLA